MNLIWRSQKLIAILHKIDAKSFSFVIQYFQYQVRRRFQPWLMNFFWSGMTLRAMWSAGQLNRLVQLCIDSNLVVCVTYLLCLTADPRICYALCSETHLTRLQKLQKHDGRLAWPNMGTITVTQRSIFPIKICKKVLWDMKWIGANSAKKCGRSGPRFNHFKDCPLGILSPPVFQVVAS